MLCPGILWIKLMPNSRGKVWSFRVKTDNVTWLCGYYIYNYVSGVTNFDQMWGFVKENTFVHVIIFKNSEHTEIVICAF